MKVFRLQWIAITVTLLGWVEGKPRFTPDDNGLSYQDYVRTLAAIL